MTTDSRAPLVPFQHRLLIALGIGFLAAAITFRFGRMFPGAVTDFDQIWFAGGALLHGRDPYPLIGPGREFDYQFPFYYPLPAAVIVAPLALLPLLAARMVMVGASAAALAFVSTRDSYHRLPAFLSVAFMINVKIVQWPPLLACALFAPWFGLFLAAKPNLGLAVLAGSRSLRWAIIGGASALAVTVVAFTIQPSWFGEWRSALHGSTHFLSPIMLPVGFPLVLSLLRWRRWEGRLLAALSIVPQTPGVSAAFLLCLIPPTLRGVLLLSLLSAVVVIVLPATNAFATFTQSAYAGAYATIALLYLPALWIVLRLPKAEANQGGAHRDSTK
jgi:hypothetical protein